MFDFKNGFVKIAEAGFSMATFAISKKKKNKLVETSTLHILHSKL